MYVIYINIRMISKTLMKWIQQLCCYLLLLLFNKENTQTVNNLVFYAFFMHSCRYLKLICIVTKNNIQIKIPWNWRYFFIIFWHWMNNIAIQWCKQITFLNIIIFHQCFCGTCYFYLNLWDEKCKATFNSTALYL